MKNLKPMYEVREFVGNNYSKALEFKLRNRKSAMNVAKRLNRAKRSVFIAKVMVYFAATH